MEEERKINYEKRDRLPRKKAKILPNAIDSDDIEELGKALVTTKSRIINKDNVISFCSDRDLSTL